MRVEDKGVGGLLLTLSLDLMLFKYTPTSAMSSTSITRSSSITVDSRITRAIDMSVSLASNNAIVTNSRGAVRIRTNTGLLTIVGRGCAVRRTSKFVATVSKRARIRRATSAGTGC